MKKYQIIYADPPWTYQDKALAGNRGACCKYPVMDQASIYWLGRKLAPHIAKDCVLFMWVTAPKLNEVFHIISGWGFKYKTKGFIWIKKNKKANTLFWGMGRWTRANSEDCLLATRGNPKRASAAVHQVIEAPIREHSRKPDEVRNRIVTLMGDLPRIELFAREKTDGWDVWGNEVQSDIEL